MDHDHHFESVNQHGDEAMGFSHMKTTHHFRLAAAGGSIEVQANDPKDTATRDQIRSHLREITQAFKAGNFSAPEYTHSRVPPGVTVMQGMKADIHYLYQDLPLGGRVSISSKMTKAVGAIHDFLRFQIEDHQTGDSLKIENH